MKTKRKILSIFLSLIVIFQMINNIRINSLAAGGYFTTDSFTLTSGAYQTNGQSFDAYTMQDDSGLLSGFYYYFKVSDGKAICCDGGEVITNILNYKIGVTMSLQTLTNFISSYVGNNSFTGQDPQYYNLIKPVLKNGVLVGVALNDISGCKMAYTENSDQVSIPTNEVNNVYNYFIYYQTLNPVTPDYINVQTINKSQATSLLNFSYSQTVYERSLDFINSHSNFMCMYKNTATSSNYGTIAVANGTGSAGNPYTGVGTLYTDDLIFIATQGYSSICQAFNLSDDNIQISYDDLSLSTGTYDLKVNFYNSDFTLNNPTLLDWNGNTSTRSTTDIGVAYRSGTISMYPYSDTSKYLTIYKNATIINDITNNNYQKTIYYSTTYTNYNTNNDNSYNTNVQNINNSSSNNTNIYNETKTENNTNIKENNYNYDYSQNNSNNTTIINNYYGDNGSGDNGGGDDDDDDDTIWKALLKAIGDFFKKIGELIATLLTGIFSIFTSILDAITSITEDFTSITSFISSFFSWLPAPITSLIVLGLGLALICAFLTWFKK